MRKQKCNCNQPPKQEGDSGNPKSNNKSRPPKVIKRPKNYKPPLFLVITVTVPDSYGGGRYQIKTAKEMRDIYAKELRQGSLDVNGYNYYELNPAIDKTDMLVFKAAALAAYPAEGDYIYDIVTGQAYLKEGQNT